MLRIICFLLLVCNITTAQEPFSDGKKIHTRIMFDGKATIDIPDHYSMSKFGMLYEGEDSNSTVEADVTYSNTHHTEVVTCVLLKGTQTAQELIDGMLLIKETYNDQYHNVLRDELVEQDGATYCYYECVLKDELYTDTGKPGFEYDDGTVSPNYFLLCYMLHNGRQIHTAIHYDGKKDGLEDFRSRAQQMITSLKML